MRIYLVRHGKDQEGIRGGWSDQPLTEEGRRQARELAEQIDFPVDALYSSDLPRAMQTAEPIGKRLGLSIICRPEFRETNNGELAGMRNEIALVQYPGLFWNTLGWEERYPGGESPREFYERICRAWDTFQKEVLTSGENAMLVTHSGVIHVIRCLLAGRRYSNKVKHPKVEHAKPIVLKFEDAIWKEVEL